MTARPRRARRQAPREEFCPVEVPAEVLAAARSESCGVAAADVVEDWLVDAHGPAPDHREDHARFSAWHDATAGRALDLLAAGVLA